MLVLRFRYPLPSTRLGSLNNNTRVNQPARTLVSMGVGSKQIVALALPWCAGGIVAILAVLKTKTAYLPLDLGYPAAQIELMLADVQPPLLLTPTHIIVSIPAHVPAARLVLGDRATLTTLSTQTEIDPLKELVRWSVR